MFGREDATSTKTELIRGRDQQSAADQIEFDSLAIREDSAGQLTAQLKIVNLVIIDNAKMRH